jgi:hypothetical protein
MNKKLLFAVTLVLMVSTIYSQTSKFTVLANGEQTNNPAEVSASGLELFIVQVDNVQDLKQYDLVTASLTYPELSDTKYPSFFQDTGAEMAAICKDSKKNPGTQFIQMVITSDPNGAYPNIGFFKKDAYPFGKISFNDIFSKQANSNVDNYTMSFVLTGQMIVKYDEKWEDGVLKKIPVYGPHKSLSKAISITIITQ